LFYSGGRGRRRIRRGVPSSAEKKELVGADRCRTMDELPFLNGHAVLVSELRGLREGFLRFGGHWPNCKCVTHGSEEKCTCGFDEFFWDHFGPNGLRPPATP